MFSSFCSLADLDLTPPNILSHMNYLSHKADKQVVKQNHVILWYEIIAQTKLLSFNVWSILKRKKVRVNKTQRKEKHKLLYLCSKADVGIFPRNSDSSFKLRVVSSITLFFFLSSLKK